MILGTLLRFWDLPKQSLWLDEFTSIQFASLPLHDLFSGKGFNWHTPPFYYIALHFWGRLFPLTEIGLRLFSLTCDLACIPVCYFAFLEFSRGKLAEHRKSIAIAGAMLYTVSPFAIYYAQDGRMYTLLMLLALSTVYCAALLSRNARPCISTATLAVLAILGSYTHYYYILLLLGVTGWFVLRFLINRSSATFASARNWVAAMAVAGIAYLPWMSVVVSLAASGGQEFRSNSLSALLLCFPYTLLRFAAGYAVFPLTADVKAGLVAGVKQNISVIAPLMLLHGVCFLGGLLALRDLRAKALLYFAILTPPLVALLVSLKAPMLSERYLSVIYPFYLFVISCTAAGGSLRNYPKLRLGLLWMLTLASLFGMHRMHSNPDFGHPDWRRVRALISEGVEPKDGIEVVMNPEYYRDLADFYLPESVRITAVHGAAPNYLAEAQQALSALATRTNSAWLIETGNAESIRAEAEKLGTVTEIERFVQENGLTLFRIQFR